MSIKLGHVHHMHLQARQPSFVHIFLGFIIGLALITLCTFRWAFQQALVSSFGTTTEIEDINFTLGMFGTVLISFNTLLVLGLLQLLTKRRVPVLVYLVGAALGPLTYHLTWLQITPLVLTGFDINQPVYDFAPRTLSGINASVYLAFLHRQEAVTWTCATLFSLVVLSPMLWVALHRKPQKNL